MEESAGSGQVSSTPAKAGTDKAKILILFLVAAVIVLLVGFIYTYKENLGFVRAQEKAQNGLLSAKVYYGIGPKSFTIINFNPLQTAMQQIITGNKWNVSVYVENLRNGRSFGINSREGAFPASLNKLPVAILIMQKVDLGEFTLDSMVPISESFVPEETTQLTTNGEEVLAQQISLDVYKNNKQLPVRFLMEELLRKSDNNALNLLLTQVDKDSLARLLNYFEVDVLGSYDYNASTKSRLLGPKSLANIFASLYYSTVLEPESSEYILSLIANTTFDLRPLLQLPDYVIIAHKYGVYSPDNERIFHDCGILYIKSSKILYCITVKGQGEPGAISIIATLLRLTYDYTTQERSELDVYKERGYI